MATDSATAYAVYLGPWTDWSKGRVLGATLTLTRQDGSLLIAFLAFFVALVGTRFWRLGCLILHYTYSKDGPSDGVYHQRQVFLRNAPNPEGALWTLADMGFSWKANAKEVWSRLLPPFGLAVVSFVGFALAGGYSSRVATLVNSQVLLSSVNCSFINNADNMTTFGEAEGPAVVEELMAAETYARQCYTSQSGSLGANCGTYVKRQLAPAVVDTNASCPFDTKVCKSAAGNLFIDTGFLDSHDDFGRNTPTNRRIQFRRTVHCAPLATEGYRFRTHDDATNQTYTTYYYGPMANVNGTTTNYTTQYLSDVYPGIEELTHSGEDTVHDFGVRIHYASWWNGKVDTNSSSFFPISELTLQDTNLNMFFLTSGRVLFDRPSNDAWYGGTTNTTQVHKLKISDWGNWTFYRQSEPGMPLACLEQEQWCFTGASGQKKCTTLNDPPDAIDDMFKLREKGDEEWVWWLLRTIFATIPGIRSPLSMLGTHALQARDKLNGPILGVLPDNQWQLEIQHWHATTMAQLQYLFLRSTIGFADPKWAHQVVYPQTATQKELCANQKILAAGFVSVSIFGLALILAVGSIIIVLSFILGPMLSCCLKRRGRYRYAKLEWSTTDAFQLQRMAHEGTGMGTWSRGTKSIPVTRLGEVLAVMDIANPKHPKLTAYEPAVNLIEKIDQRSAEDHDTENQDDRDLGSHDLEEKP